MGAPLQACVACLASPTSRPDGDPARWRRPPALGHYQAMTPPLIHPRSIGEAAASTRFERKRELILDAATVLINERGVKGMTFVEVAQQVKLNTASVTYYFRLKEQLAAAVFERTLDRLQAMASEAGAEPDPKSRVGRYLGLYFELQSRIRRGEDRPIALLSDMRALDEPVRAPLTRHYSAIFASCGTSSASREMRRTRRCRPRAPRP